MLNTPIVLAENGGVFYEGDHSQLWAINPAPVISSAAFQLKLAPTPSAGVIFDALFFREDYFDATTRVRRGRFYGNDGTGHNRQWYASKVSTWPRPAIPEAPVGIVQMHTVFRPIKIEGSSHGLLRDTIVTLGTAGYESDWHIIDVELTVKDELYFTLKPVFVYGILPRLATDDEDVRRAYNDVLDASLKSNAIPIVDVCRNSAFLVLHKIYGEAKELSKMIGKIPPDKVMITSSAHILNRLHPRGKAAEQLRPATDGRKLRPIVDEDAGLAVKLFGLLLVELGFATY